MEMTSEQKRTKLYAHTEAHVREEHAEAFAKDPGMVRWPPSLGGATKRSKAALERVPTHPHPLPAPHLCSRKTHHRPPTAAG